MDVEPIIKAANMCGDRPVGDSWTSKIMATVSVRVCECASVCECVRVTGVWSFITCASDTVCFSHPFHPLLYPKLEKFRGSSTATR